MNRLVRISSIALMVAICVGVSVCSICLAQTLTGTENPTPLWPDNVATMSGADFTALLTKLQPLVPKELAGKPYSIQPGEDAWNLSGQMGQRLNGVETSALDGG